MSKRPLQWWLLFAALVCAGSAHAFETMNRIRAEGTLRVGVLDDRVDPAVEERVERLGAFVDATPILTRFDRPDALVEALEDGTIDVVASPLDMQRPVPSSLTFTHAVDHADLAELGPRGAPWVRFTSDAWYRVVAMREAGDTRAVRMLPPAEDPFDRATDGVLLLAPPAQLPGGRILASRVPRAWLHRGDDRVLAFKLNRFIQTEALRLDAAQHAEVPPARLIRASLRGEPLTPWDDLAQRHGRFHGLDWRLLLAVMYKESRFDPDAVSSSGARGLMQLKAIAADEVGLEHFLDPADNVLAGSRYLAWVLERFDETTDPAERIWLSLAAYNGGLTHVRAAQRHARSNGRDPHRWFGHVEHSMREIAAQRPSLRAGRVIGYVRDVRATLGTYMRLTEGRPAPLRAETPATALAASP